MFRLAIVQASFNFRSCNTCFVMCSIRLVLRSLRPNTDQDIHSPYNTGTNSNMQVMSANILNRKKKLF